jgi:hypothetical protein
VEELERVCHGRRLTHGRDERWWLPARGRVDHTDRHFLADRGAGWAAHHRPHPLDKIDEGNPGGVPSMGAPVDHRDGGYPPDPFGREALDIDAAAAGA